MGRYDAGICYVRSQGTYHEGGGIGANLDGIGANAGGDVDGIVHDYAIDFIREGHIPGQNQGSGAVGNQTEILGWPIGNWNK